MWQAIFGTVFGWASIATVVPLLIGIAFALVSLTPAEFWASRVCLALAAAMIAVRISATLVEVPLNLGPRLLLAALAFGITGVALVEGWRWIDTREAIATHDVVAIPAEVTLRDQVQEFIAEGELVRDAFWSDFRLLSSGHPILHIDQYRRYAIERWRERLQACLDAQRVLRPEVRGYVMTGSGDRLTGSIDRLRDVLRDWQQWRVIG